MPLRGGETTSLFRKVSFCVQSHRFIGLLYHNIISVSKIPAFHTSMETMILNAG